MSICNRCGAQFSCAMADGAASDQPCWCVALPAVMPVPGGEAGQSCWCPACLGEVIAQQRADADPGHKPKDRRAGALRRPTSRAGGDPY